MKNLDLQITSMPPTRLADYYLSCLDGSVFMDFNCIGNRVCLIRISFDGYGCCNLGTNAIPLNEEESTIFKKNMKPRHFTQNIMEQLVRKAILLNKSLIWQEALIEYELI